MLSSTQLGGMWVHCKFSIGAWGGASGACHIQQHDCNEPHDFLRHHTTHSRNPVHMFKVTVYA